MTVIIKYDKIGVKRYLRTITRDANVLKSKLNFQILKNKTEKDLETDFKKVKKQLTGY